MSFDPGAAYLDEAYRGLRGHKRLGDGAMAQVSDDEFFRVLNPESNSIALIVKHITGNMRSRFVDFLTSDGEKPWRQRDNEFIQTNEDHRAALMERWEDGWKLVLDTVQSLKPNDLSRIVTIRTEELTVLQAVNRQVMHYAYHVGQIVFLAKYWSGGEWKSLSIPRGMSEQVNAKFVAEHTKNRRG